MSFIRLGISTTVLLLSSGCNVEPATIRSFIGTEEKLPPAELGLEDKVSITLWKRGDPSDQINILITPDRIIHVLKYNVRLRAGLPEVTKQKLDQIALSPYLFVEFHSRLAAYRPKAPFDEEYISPRDCYPRTHDVGIIGIGFLTPQGREGHFYLHQSCTAFSAALVKRDLKQVLALLPPLKGTAGYGWF